MPTSELIHLAIDLSSIHNSGAWNIPGGWKGYPRYPNPRMLQDVAAIAERGRLDMCFFGDGTSIPDTYQGSRDAGAKWGVWWPRQDMAAFIPLLAAATEQIGFGYTCSPSFMHPYQIARLTNSMDHATGGRLALNLVTSTRLGDFANYGMDQLIEHGTRYERMVEFIDICSKLWAGVEPDAIIMDPETGQFADPKKVRAINYKGKFWNVRGPLNCMPSPQGRPVLLQAGQSDRGIEVSAQFADYVFASPGSPEFQRSHRERLNNYAKQAGRSPRDIGVLWSASVVVAETEEEVKAKLARLKKPLPLEAIAADASYNSGFDYSRLPDKFTLGEARDLIEADNASKMGLVQRLILQEGEELEITKDELLQHHYEQSTRKVIAGTPSQVADRLEEIHENGERNGGVMLSPNGPSPRQYQEIVDLLIPELQARGVFRKEYEGSTLRDHLNQ